MTEWPDVPIEGGELTSGQVCFVGQGSTAVCWYRCALPAMFMGADWAGLLGEPGKAVKQATGLVRGQTKMPDLSTYKVVVLQQPGWGWATVIEQLQEQGVTVLFEVDDHLRSVRKMASHDFAEFFTLKYLKELEANMRRCDGVIVSTDFLARWVQLQKLNERVWVCQNGLDLARYNLTRPKRPTVNIGWAGATGHEKVVRPYMEAALTCMSTREATCFVSIGQPFAEGFRHVVGEERTIVVPWTLVDQYPAAMTLIDVGIAPAGHTSFFMAKSDLRFLEAGALGIPLVAEPKVYHSIEHGVTGFLPTDQLQVMEHLGQLLDDEQLRTEMGENARAYVREHRDMRVAVKAWERALSEAVA